MEYRILGKTGLKISRMGFGGIPIQRIDAEGTKALMHKLLENGVNYIDTARGYTVSEEYLGVGLEGIREQFVLATKSMSRTAEAMAKDIDISLKISAPTILTCTRFTTRPLRIWRRSTPPAARWKP